MAKFQGVLLYALWLHNATTGTRGGPCEGCGKETRILSLRDDVVLYICSSCLEAAGDYRTPRAPTPDERERVDRLIGADDESMQRYFAHWAFLYAR